MRKIILFFTLVTAVSFGFCQSTNLKPVITEDGLYCLDSTQIREVARLVTVNQAKDQVIQEQDSLIETQKQNEQTSQAIIKKKDTLLANNNQVIKNQERSLQIKDRTHELEIQTIKKKNRKTLKAFFIAITIESLVLLVLIVSK